MIRTIIPDKTTAVTAAQAITAALFARERTRKGQHVKLAMLDTMVSYLWPEGMAGMTWWVVKSKPSARSSHQILFLPPRTDFTAGAVSNVEWQGMCKALDRLEWLDDERFLTVNDRAVNVTQRLEMTAEVIATNSSIIGCSA